MRRPMTLLLPDDLPLEYQLLRECQAMTRYALTSGFKVPSTLVKELSICIARYTEQHKQDPIEYQDLSDAEHEEPAGIPMSQHRMVENTTMLAKLHAQLSSIVAPAMPRTILLLEDEVFRQSRWITDSYLRTADKDVAARNQSPIVISLSFPITCRVSASKSEYPIALISQLLYLRTLLGID